MKPSAEPVILHVLICLKTYKHDTGPYTVEQVVHVEASWHHSKGKGVVEETQFIESLAFGVDTVKLGGIVATADPRDRNFKKDPKITP